MGDDQPLAVYPVRTAPGYWFAAGVMFAFAAVGAAALAFVVLTSKGIKVTHLWDGFTLVALVAAGVPLLYWLLTGAYRIGGGKSTIRFFADRLEVPAASAGRRIVFLRSTLTASSREIRVRYTIAGFTAATMRRGYLVKFRGGGNSRDLSTLTVDKPTAFLADLILYIEGLAPVGPDNWKPPPPPERTKHDDRLDAELDMLDH